MPWYWTCNNQGFQNKNIIANGLNQFGLSYKENLRFLWAAVECCRIKKAVQSHYIELLNNRNSISFHTWKLFGLGSLRISVHFKQHDWNWHFKMPVFYTVIQHFRRLHRIGPFNFFTTSVLPLGSWKKGCYTSPVWLCFWHCQFVFVFV